MFWTVWGSIVMARKGSRHGGYWFFDFLSHATFFCLAFADIDNKQDLVDGVNTLITSGNG